jgi:hypothetical protein
MLHIYKLAQKLKIKKRKGENQTKFESIIVFFLPPSSFIFWWLILMVWHVVYLLVL